MSPRHRNLILAVAIAALGIGIVVVALPRFGGEPVTYRNLRYVRTTANKAAGLFEVRRYEAEGPRYLLELRDGLHKTDDDVDAYERRVALRVDPERGTLTAWSFGPNGIDENGAGDDVAWTEEYYDDRR